MAQDVCIRFGERLRKLREKQNWSQEDLAAKSGIAQNFISKLENGKKEPCLRTIETLSDTFKLSISRFMSRL
jgi:transcriptional regulator with XRE-family HTH domain